MNAILISADPKQSNIVVAIDHLQTHQKLFYEVKFPIFAKQFPIAGFIHISGTGDMVQYVACIDGIEPFSKDHYERPDLYGDVRPNKWDKR